MSSAAIVRRRLSGVVFLLVPALLAWLAVAVYNKDFSGGDTVQVRTDSVGNQMHQGADVKLDGVVVGQVRGISADGNGARLTLDIAPGQLKRIPSDVTAQMLPTTLFGERFVALVRPAADASATGNASATGGGSLRAGSTIPQDRSKDAVELEQVLGHVLPLLTAVQPEKLSATLTAVAQALDGRGTELGSTLTRLDSYLAGLNPDLPALDQDIHQLVQVSRTYTTAAPDILQALTEFTTTSNTIVQQQSQLATLYGTTTGTADDLTAFLRKNKDNIIRLSTDSRPTLQLLSRYSSEFPCTLRTLTDFVPAMDQALGKGTDQPGLHVDVTMVPSRGQYLPGKDKPVYRADSGPRPCTLAPAPAATTGTDATSAARPAAPNSPAENQLVDELLAPSLGLAPSGLPSWSSVLAGPVFRGAQVTIR
ncbi:MCE family protein [Streptacidiphilus sp. N1-3]|uniref:MCE family protein n=1 Tax=Streptacidiphilus alkalitolerans TaxID=3342712 RepID=A0ABV6XCX7_9ACTN